MPVPTGARSLPAAGDGARPPHRASPLPFPRTISTFCGREDEATLPFLLPFVFEDGRALYDGVVVIPLAGCASTLR